MINADSGNSVEDATAEAVPVGLTAFSFGFNDFEEHGTRSTCVDSETGTGVVDEDDLDDDASA